MRHPSRSLVRLTWAAGIAAALLFCACQYSPAPDLAGQPAIELAPTRVVLDLPRDEAGLFYPVSLVRANDDPWPDLYVQRLFPVNDVYLSLGTPEGFGPFKSAAGGFGGFPTEYPTLFGDLDGDGMADALVQKKNHVVWAGLTRGQRLEYRQKSFDGGAFVVDLPTMIMDMTGDGCQDVVIVNLWPDILLCENLCQEDSGHTQVRFRHHRVVSHLPDDPRGFAFAGGDVNGDGLNDWLIFTGTAGKNWENHQVYVALNAEHGTKTGDFYPASQVPLGRLGGENWPPLVADITGDGRADILVSFTDGRLFLYQNNGKGYFNVAPQPYCCLGGSAFDNHPMQHMKLPDGRVMVMIQERREAAVQFAVLAPPAP